MVRIPYDKWHKIKHTSEFWAGCDGSISIEERELGVIHFSEYADPNNPDPANLIYWTIVPKFLLSNFKAVVFHDDVLGDALDAFNNEKDESLSSNIIFEWNMREEQIPLINDVMTAYNEKGSVNGLIIANPGFGKGLVNSDKVVTPSGWKRVDQVQVGDDLIDFNGHATKVLGVYPQGEKIIFKVCFDNDTSVCCDEEHLWEVSNEANVFSVKQTKDLFELVLDKSDDADIYSVSLCRPVNFINQQPFHITPIIKGCLINKMYGYDVPLEKQHLINNLAQHYKVMKINDRIPNAFLFDSIERREELLDSILHDNEFKCVSYNMAKDILHIIQSLGIYHYACKKTIFADPDDEEELIEYYHIKIDRNISKKRITRIEVMPNSRETTCFKVDNERHLFLCNDFTVTHNTASSIKISSEIKKQTLVVVPNDVLEKQWVESIIASTNLERDDIGVIQGSDISKLIKQDMYSKPIAVTKVQSLLSQLKTFNMESLETLYSRYGLIFYDECHTSGSAESYSKTSFLFKTKNIIGLSATPYVKGINKFLLNNGIGPIIHISGHQNLIADVHLHNIFLEFTDQEINRLRASMGDYIYFMSALNNILESKPAYFEYLCQWVLYYKSQGRKIAVLFSNNKLIDKMNTMLRIKGLKDDVGILIGDTEGKIKKQEEYITVDDYQLFADNLKQYKPKAKLPILKPLAEGKFKFTKKQLELINDVNDYIIRSGQQQLIDIKKTDIQKTDRDLNGEKQIILSNFKLLSAGYDNTELSVAIFGSLVIGKITVNQTIGRITRIHKDKPTPQAHFMFPWIYTQMFPNNHYVLSNNIKAQFPTTKFTYENFPKKEVIVQAPVMPVIPAFDPLGSVQLSNKGNI